MGGDPGTTGEPMSDKQFLGLAHLLLFVLQMAVAAMVILFDSRFVALSPIVSGFQAKLPFPNFKE